MPQDPLFELPQYKDEKSLVPGVYRRISPLPPSYHDLAPSKLAENVRTAQNPLIRDDNMRTMGQRTVDMISKSLLFMLGEPITSADSPEARRRREYIAERDIENIKGYWKPAVRFSEDIIYNISPEEQDPFGVMLGEAPKGPNPLIDPTFDWSHKFDLWRELSQKIPPMFHDDLLISRSYLHH